MNYFNRFSNIELSNFQIQEFIQYILFFSHVHIFILHTWERRTYQKETKHNRKKPTIETKKPSVSEKGTPLICFCFSKVFGLCLLVILAYRFSSVTSAFVCAFLSYEMRSILCFSHLLKHLYVIETTSS